MDASFTSNKSAECNCTKFMSTSLLPTTSTSSARADKQGFSCNLTTAAGCRLSNADYEGFTRPEPFALWMELLAFIIIDVVGFVGNCFVVAVVLLCNNMRTSANLFILSLSIADLMVTILVIPTLIAARHDRAWPFSDVMCSVQAWVNHATLFASIFSLAAIAVNRVVVTRAVTRYQNLFSIPLSCLYISVAWFFAIMFASFPLMGWGRFTFDPKRSNCIFSRKDAPSYSIFFASCGVILPLFICAVSYIIIWVNFAQSKHNLRQFPGFSNQIGSATASEAKLTKNLFVVWLAFFFCWLPMNVLLFVDPKGLLDERIYTFAVWSLLCNSCFNPIIYGVQNKNFRRGYLRIMAKLRIVKGGNRNVVFPDSSHTRKRGQQFPVVVDKRPSCSHPTSNRNSDTTTKDTKIPHSIPSNRSNTSKSAAHEDSPILNQLNIPGQSGYSNSTNFQITDSSGADIEVSIQTDLVDMPASRQRNSSL